MKSSKTVQEKQTCKDFAILYIYIAQAESPQKFDNSETDLLLQSCVVISFSH